ncbi:MAG: hypothetical protein DMF82_07310 [Acidobacteria bacterium]|nr:MAG: hypothetical protein DMF82_07310 [Acidobacteriota bacterium]
MLGLGAALVLLFSAAFVLVARHGGRESRLGWQPARAPEGRVLVGRVDPDGPAAGVLAPGDRVIAIDGDPRVSWPPFGWLIQPLPRGGHYALRVIRDGREIEMSLPVMAWTRPGWQWTAVVRAIVALLLCTSGLTVGFLRPEQRAARLHALAVLMSAPIFFANPILLNMLRSGLLTPGESLVVWLCRIHSPFHGAVGFHSALEFPRAGGHGRARRWVKVLFYAWAAVVCALYNLEYYSMIFRPEVARAFTWEHPLLWRALFTLDWLFGPVIFAAIPAAIVLNAREETSPGELRRVRWAFFGALVAFVPLLALYTLRFVQEVLLSGARLVSPETESVLDNLAFLFLGVAPITLAYAVVKHRVFGIRIVIRRGVRYLLARNVLRAVLVLPLALLLASVLLNPQRTVGQILFRHPVHLVLIAGAALSLRFRRALARGIDRRFFREAYDQERVLLALVDDIRARDSLTDLSRLVSDRLGATLHPERLYLVYRRLEGRDFSLEYSSGGGSSSGLLIAEDSALVRVMQDRTGTLEPEAADASLPAEERELLSRLGVRLVVPMRTAEGRLVGMILLGEKKSEVPYGPDDRRLLQAVAAQIAILYENTALKRRVAREEQSRREVLSRLAPGEVNIVKECPRCGTCWDAVVETCPRDGAPLSMTIPVERVVDEKYRLERVIGTGGMGTVYEATDLRLGRSVALKILLARNFGNPGALRRFEREAQAAARLRHPNIVTVHDYGTLGNEGAYLVMELLKGTTLRSELDRAGSARRRCDPPRPEARQRDRHPRRAGARGPQDPRLRPRQAELRRAARSQEPDRPGHGPRHPAVHVARAALWRPHRRADRRVLDRGPGGRGPHRAASLPGADDGGHGQRHPPGAVPRRRRRAGVEGAGPRAAALPGQRPRRPLRERGRPAPRAGPGHPGLPAVSGHAPRELGPRDDRGRRAGPARPGRGGRGRRRSASTRRPLPRCPRRRPETG